MNESCEIYDEKIEAMKMALTTLEGWSNYDYWIWPISALEQAKKDTVEAVAALKKSLSHQNQFVEDKIKTAKEEYEEYLRFKWKEEYEEYLRLKWKFEGADTGD